MPRARTGTLIYKRTTGWNARVWVHVKDEQSGEVREERRWVPLATHDRDLAKRKLAKIVSMVASGEIVADAARVEAKREETYAEYEDAFFVRRRAQGIRSVADEESVSKRQVRERLGGMLLSTIRPAHVRGVLQDAVEGGLRKNSVRTIRAVMFRTLRAAWEDELITENPVARVRVPRMNEIKRARMILSDEEIGRYIASPRAKRVDLKIMSLTARTEGGMRTGDITRWDWAMIDLDGFAECVIPRAKKGQPQRLEIPEVLRPFLRAWWETQEAPSAGPIFPGIRGIHRGKARAQRGTSFAGVLRRELLRAGVVRHDCDGSCSRAKDPKPCPNFAADPLHNDTATTQRVDFHSFRRAFNTGLAEAGVNVQQAMHLAGHSDPKVHAMYVMSTRRMQQIPAAALPRLPLGSGTAVPNHEDASHEEPMFSRRGSDSNRRMTVLQGEAEQGEGESLHALASWSWVERALQIPPCCFMSSGEKTPPGASSIRDGRTTRQPFAAVVHAGELIWN